MAIWQFASLSSFQCSSIGFSWACALTVQVCFSFPLWATDPLSSHELCQWTVKSVTNNTKSVINQMLCFVCMFLGLAAFSVLCVQGFFWGGGWRPVQTCLSGIQVTWFQTEQTGWSACDCWLQLNVVNLTIKDVHWKIHGILCYRKRCFIFEFPLSHSQSSRACGICSMSGRMLLIGVVQGTSIFTKTSKLIFSFVSSYHKSF